MNRLKGKFTIVGSQVRSFKKDKTLSLANELVHFIQIPIRDKNYSSLWFILPVFLYPLFSTYTLDPYSVTSKSLPRQDRINSSLCLHFL